MTETETTGTAEKGRMKVSRQEEEEAEVTFLEEEGEIVMEEDGVKGLEEAEEGTISFPEGEVVEEEEGVMDNTMIEALTSQEGVVVEEVGLMIEAEEGEIGECGRKITEIIREE